MVRCTILTFKTMPFAVFREKLPSFGIFHGNIENTPEWDSDDTKTIFTTNMYPRREV